MAKLDTFVCNVCGKQRASDTNHWRRVLVLQADESGKSAGIIFVEWGRTKHSDADVCGDQCSATIFSRWLATGSIEGSKQEEKING
ncbi:MAG: hypothetical protein ACLP1Y_09065 [Candidatus Acidiferrales bacterium]